MKINLRQLRMLSIWTCISFFITWLLLAGYFIVTSVDFNLSMLAISEISLIAIIIFSILMAISILSSIFIAKTLSTKSKASYINIIPLFLCIPAIISCTKYINEQNSISVNDITHREYSESY